MTASSGFRHHITRSPHHPFTLRHHRNWEDCMKHTLLFSTALLMALGQWQPASAQAPIDLVKQGIEAQGGANAVRAIKSLVLKGTYKSWEPGQGYSINGETRFLGDSKITISVDYGNPLRVRYDHERDMLYPAVEKV